MTPDEAQAALKAKRQPSLKTLDREEANLRKRAQSRARARAMGALARLHPQDMDTLYEVALAEELNR